MQRETLQSELQDGMALSCFMFRFFASIQFDLHVNIILNIDRYPWIEKYD